MRIQLHPVVRALLAALVLVPAGPPRQTEPLLVGDPVIVSATLGTVVTAGAKLDNTGQAATEVLLYEAFEEAVATAGDPPTAPLRVPLPEVAGPLAPGLLEDLAAALGGEGDLLIFLDEQADLSAAAAIADWNARGAAVVAALQAQAAQSQAPLLAELRAPKKSKARKPQPQNV